MKRVSNYIGSTLIVIGVIVILIFASKAVQMLALMLAYMFGVSFPINDISKFNQTVFAITFLLVLIYFGYRLYRAVHRGRSRYF